MFLAVLPEEDGNEKEEALRASAGPLCYRLFKCLADLFLGLQQQLFHIAAVYIQPLAPKGTGFRNLEKVFAQGVQVPKAVIRFDIASGGGYINQPFGLARSFGRAIVIPKGNAGNTPYSRLYRERIAYRL